MRSTLLRRGAAQEAAAEHHRVEIGLDHEITAQRFHHDHGLDRTGTEAAIVLGERQAEQALLRKLAPDVAAPAALLGAILLAGLEFVGRFQQAVDAVLEEALLL